MPLCYDIDTTRGVVLVEMTGTVSVDETVSLLERLAADPAFRPSMPQLVDVTGTDAPPSVAESESIANAFSRFRRSFACARCAVIVKAPHMYGAVRQFAALASRSGVEVRPFHDRAQAEGWLRIDSGMADA